MMRQFRIRKESERGNPSLRLHAIYKYVIFEDGVYKLTPEVHKHVIFLDVLEAINVIETADIEGVDNTFTEDFIIQMFTSQNQWIDVEVVEKVDIMKKIKRMQGI